MARRRRILGRLGAGRREPPPASELEDEDAGETGEFPDHWSASFEDEDSSVGADTESWAPPEDPDEEPSEEHAAGDPPPAQDPEIRALGEIQALEESLEALRSSAAQTAKERDEIEQRTREAATKWARRQIAEIRREAHAKARGEVEAEVRAEAEERIRSASEQLRRDAGERIDAASDDATEPADEADRLRRQRDAAATLLAETLARLEEAEVRAASAQGSAKVEELERELDAARAEAEERLEAAAEQARLEVAGKVDEEIERRAAQARQEASERIAKVEADAEERLRAEVGVARKAAEERFAEELAARERDLHAEREQKVQLAEQAEGRLKGIEERAADAAERVAAAELMLAEETERIRDESEARVVAETERARRDAEAAADERVSEHEAELVDALERAEDAERQAAERISEAEGRIRDAEERAAETVREARLAAAAWVRGQTKALRREGEAAAPVPEPTPAIEPEPEPDPPTEPEPEPEAEPEPEPEAEAEPVQEPTEERPAASEPPDVMVDETAEWRVETAGEAEPEADEDEIEDEVDEPDTAERVSLATADLEQLRGTGMSTAQARRVLRYRERHELISVEDLEEIPGFPRPFLAELGERLD